MFKKFIAVTAGLTIAWAAIGATDTPDPTPSLKDQINAMDKELAVLRKNTLSDPKVKAAEADFEMAFARLKATEDAVLIRTDPHAKELVEKFRKLLDQYKAQQKADAAKTGAKQ
jgi:hypothetical protein